MAWRLQISGTSALSTISAVLKSVLLSVSGMYESYLAQPHDLLSVLVVAAYKQPPATYIVRIAKSLNRCLATPLIKRTSY
jgi:hypothetical protein